ncbi:hypothetical protein DAF77_14135 [Clostridioides difficile]|nr:hypothetical protein [Clostridioides difficile]EGT5014185.1 hypothetical protein [Clostridioides difficile]
MARKKTQLDVSGLEEYIKKLENLNKDLKKTFESALHSTNSHVTKKIKPAIAKHKQTGATESSINKENEVTWQGTTAITRVGFDIKNKGLASIFLMYGTPKMTPDRQLYNAFYSNKTKKEILEIQQEVFRKRIERL